MTPRLVDVLALMRDGRKSSTYKPALLKSIARLTRRSERTAIPLRELGVDFGRLYWNQTIVFRLRQAATISKEPEVPQIVRETSERARERHFERLGETDRERLGSRIGKVLTYDVLERFHKRGKLEMPRLFEWSKGDDSIRIAPDTLTFLRSQSPLVEMMANYSWAHFLEAVNLSAPRIIEKVRRDDAKRKSLTPYVAILLAAGESNCFYCGKTFAGDDVHVDHVLPWSFLLDDPVWDLALSCIPCNLAKSDSLPDERFIDKLVDVNLRRSTIVFERGSVSPRLDDKEIRRLYDAARAVEWPAGWAP